MTTPQPDQQRRAAKRPDGGAAMDTFTIGFPRWLAVLFGRNPLIRLSDRLEVLALVLVVVVSLLSMPIGAAVGTAVYDSRSRVYAEQAKTRTTVTATVIDSPRTQRHHQGACPMVCSRVRAHRCGQGAICVETR